MSYDPNTPARLGYLAIGADPALDENDAHGYETMAATARPERDAGMGNHGLGFMGRLPNFGFWEHDHSRRTPEGGASGSYSIAFPAVADGQGQGAIYGGPALDNFQPIESLDNSLQDIASGPVVDLGDRHARYIPKQGVTPHYGELLPAGAAVAMIPTTRHGKSPADPAAWLAVASGGPLAADHQTHKYSRWLYAVDGNALSRKRRYGIHTVLEVREWGADCSSPTSRPEYTAALVGQSVQGGRGRLHVSFGGVSAYMSHLGGGPLAPARRGDHRAFRAGDGDIMMGGITTAALFMGSAQYEGPLRFEEAPYPVVRNGVTPYEVHRKFDMAARHRTLCGRPPEGPGVWKEYVLLPLIEPPGCRVTKPRYVTIEPPASPFPVPQLPLDFVSRLVLPKHREVIGSTYWKQRSDLHKGLRRTPE